VQDDHYHCLDLLGDLEFKVSTICEDEVDGVGLDGHVKKQGKEPALLIQCLHGQRQYYIESNNDTEQVLPLNVELEVREEPHQQDRPVAHVPHDSGKEGELEGHHYRHY